MIEQALDTIAGRVFSLLSGKELAGFMLLDEHAEVIAHHVAPIVLANMARSYDEGWAGGYDDAADDIGAWQVSLDYGAAPCPNPYRAD